MRACGPLGERSPPSGSIASSTHSGMLVDEESDTGVASGVDAQDSGVFDTSGLSGIKD